MSLNGLGQFIVNSAGNPVVSGTTISSTWLNALTADIATALSAAVYKDGQQTVTANIPMGGFKVTGIGAATVTGDALSYGRAATVTSLTSTGVIQTNASGFNDTSGTGFVTSAGGSTISFTSGGVFANPNALTVQARSNGVVLAQDATAWTPASDETLKTAFVPFQNALGRISKIKTGTGRYLGEAEDISRSFLSAQSLQAVLPEAVTLYHDVSGRMPKWDGKLLADYTAVVPLLIAAFCEVKMRLEALEAPDVDL